MRESNFLLNRVIWIRQIPKHPDQLRMKGILVLVPNKLGLDLEVVSRDKLEMNRLFILEACCPIAPQVRCFLLQELEVYGHPVPFKHSSSF